MLPFLNDILSIITWQKSLLQISFAFSYILHSLSGIPDGRKMRLTNAQMYTQYRPCSSYESSAPVQKSFKIYSFQELLSTDFIHSGHSCSCGSRSLPGGEVLCWVSPVYCHREYFCLTFWSSFTFLVGFRPLFEIESKNNSKGFTSLKRFNGGKYM